MEIAASRRDRCATTSSIGSEATGAWLRRHAIAEDMGRTLRPARGLRTYVLRSENLHHRHARSCHAKRKWKVISDSHAEMFTRHGGKVAKLNRFESLPTMRHLRTGVGRFIPWATVGRLPHRAHSEIFRGFSFQKYLGPWHASLRLNKGEGRSNLFRHSGVGPVRASVCKIEKLNTKSPLQLSVSVATVGVRLNLHGDRGVEPLGCHVHKIYVQPDL